LLSDALAVVVSGLAIFVAPGAVLLRAADCRFPRDEWPARAFAASLALLTAAFAGLLFLAAPMSAAPAALAAATAVGAALARMLGRSEDAVSPRAAAPPTVLLLLALLVVGAVAAAVVFAPIGSVDRWWYLAYARSFAEAPQLRLAEPFLGTGEPFARFGVHPWLFGLALWSWMTSVDVVVLYERAAPVVVIVAAWSAAASLARALFASEAERRLAVVAAALLWSGGLVPLLARAGEDKILGAGVLMPLSFAALLGVLRGPGRLRDFFLLGIVATATAAVHALDYAFVLLVALPAAFLALRDSRGPARRAALGAVLVMLVVAAAPATTGLVVRARLAAIGAELSAADHPVVRVHEGRDRMVPLPVGGFVVSPRLLLHPFLAALLCAPLLLRRRRGDDAAVPGPASTALRDERARDFLLLSSLLPPALAFLPPLPSLVGSVIPPWMVYRVLWLLPLAPLAALAATTLARRLGRSEVAAALGLVVLAAPVVAHSLHDRLADVRGRLAAPRSAEFRALIEAVRALPEDSSLVAAPELAERLPALTGRRVVAALDRSTIVFSGSRAAGEARLRARAAILAGNADAPFLAKAARVVATHAVFDPASAATPSCAEILGTWGHYALCRLQPSGRRLSPAPALAVQSASSLRTLASATCRLSPSASRRDPWSAEAPFADCRLVVPGQWQGRGGLLLSIDAGTGRAADELRVMVRSGGRPVGRAAVRVAGDSAIVLELPLLHGDALDVRITPSFLPFVKVSRASLAIPAAWNER
jgi:hypothetical protein